MSLLRIVLKTRDTGYGSRLPGLNSSSAILALKPGQVNLTSELQFLHLLNGDHEKTTFRRLWEMNKLNDVTYLAPNLAAEVLLKYLLLSYSLF